MAKYEVLRDCYGFQGRYWEKGEIIDIDPKERPPIHFRLLTAEPKQTPEKKITRLHGEESTDSLSKKRRFRRKLTEKQKNFIKAFLRGLQGTKAVVEAYPEVKNRNTAGVMAHELRRNPKINKIIDEQLNKDNCVGDFVDFEITE